MFTHNAHEKPVGAATPAQRWARRGARRAFTLVEILTVVLILSIASAIIAPQIGSRGDLKCRAAARVLVSDLIYAQNLAIAQQKWTYVKFDAAAETYQIMDAAGPAGADHIITNPILKDPFITKLGPNSKSSLSDVLIQSAVMNGVDTAYRPSFTVAFDELGTPYVYSYTLNNTDELLDGTIVFESGPHTIKVTIERYTGEIKVE